MMEEMVRGTEREARVAVEAAAASTNHPVKIENYDERVRVEVSEAWETMTKMIVEKRGARVENPPKDVLAANMTCRNDVRVGVLVDKSVCCSPVTKGKQIVWDIYIIRNNIHMSNSKQVTFHYNHPIMETLLLLGDGWCSHKYYLLVSLEGVILSISTFLAHLT